MKISFISEYPATMAGWQQETFEWASYLAHVYVEDIAFLKKHKMGR